MGWFHRVIFLLDLFLSQSQFCLCEEGFVGREVNQLLARERLIKVKVLTHPYETRSTRRVL